MMVMDCRAAALAAGEWSDSGLFAEGQAAEFAAHLRSCPGCRGRWGALLPLILRDAGAPSAPEDSGRADAAVAALMARIPSGGRVRAASHAGAFRRRILLPALASAAILAAILGFGLPLLGGGKTVSVTFRLKAPQASSVRLAADFTSWAPTGWDMRRSGSGGEWTITVRLEKGKSYRYNFVIDGSSWVADPEAPLSLDDGFGTLSSWVNI